MSGGAGGLLSIAEALAQVLGAGTPPLPPELVPLAEADGRTLAEPLKALRTQPPFPASAMDGYALRAADAQPGQRLLVIGTAAAGHGFGGTLGPGEAVRIFTGAPVPPGADAILVQEEAETDATTVSARVAPVAGRFIRAAGLDFTAGQAMLAAGRRLDPGALALAAATGHASVPVHRQPLVAILATGDELVMPGEETGPDQIVASNPFAVGAMARRAGARTLDLGIAADDFQALEGAIARAEAAGADVLVTLGGASVGDHDLVQSSLTKRGMTLGFWRIAMRPGKPLIFGRVGPMRILGLPGNPVSSIVCARLFLVPLLRALQGDPAAGADPTEPAHLASDLPANDSRQDYLRARLHPTAGNVPRAEAFPRQDSSMLSILAQSDCLILRPPHAPAAREGDACRILRL